MVALSGLGFASVMAASAMLVLGKSDTQLAIEGPRLERELTDLRERIAELERSQAAQWGIDIQVRLEHEAAEYARQVAEDERQAAIEAARPRHCPYCREVIQRHALKCEHCGEILDADLRADRRPREYERPRQHWNPGVAAVLSFFWPGLGQIYKGQVLNGFLWWFLVVVGYVCCIVPGFILHVFCIFGAASGSDY